MRISTTLGVSVFGILMLASGPVSATDPTPAAAATTPPAATAKQVNVIDGDTVVCKSIAQTGTRFPKKVCLTKADWAYQHSSAVDALRNNHPLDRMQH
jgi:hypothetical protein